jgi:predicted ester cyclase
VEGTHLGEFLGAQPTGKRLQYRAVDLFRLEQGKIAETWPLPDVSGIVRLMQQN